MLKYDMQTKEFIPAKLDSESGKITALYARLSKEDASNGESGSITNQRDYLLKYALEHNMCNIWFFADDGFSGTTLNRPEIQIVLSLMEQRRLTNLIVKDHSRLGRNHLEVDMLTEQFKDKYDVHYVAINDGIDNLNELDCMVPIRSIFNEIYPRDTSKKIRTTFLHMGESGQRLCTTVPYGYTGNKQAWEVDPEAAEVVKEIFALSIGGLGPAQIADRLTAEGHLNPTAYMQAKGKKTHNPAPLNSTKWIASTVAKILERIEYTGCTVNFKTQKRSFKSKKIDKLPREQWKIFPNTQEAIIDEETFAQVQQIRSNRRRPTKTGQHSLFSGLMFCADCGAKMFYGTRNGEENLANFRCSNYKHGAANCSSHYIRENALRELVQAHLNQTLAFVREHQAEFIRYKQEQDSNEQKREYARKQSELSQSNQRMNELDMLFKKLYEDNISGKLNDRLFNKLSGEYEKEQNALTEKIAALTEELKQAKEKTDGINKFMALVNKYLNITELTPTIVNEFISRIEVHAPEVYGRKRIYNIDIVYNFIGIFEPNDACYYEYNTTPPKILKFINDNFKFTA